MARFDSGNIRARSRHRDLGEREHLLRTVESVEAILGADTVGNSADVDRVNNFVLHGHTMGPNRTSVQNFLQLSATFFYLVSFPAFSERPPILQKN